MPRPQARNDDHDPVHTSERILDLAECLVQTRGFNGFSYADIAASLGVTKASLHYHFPAKAALGKQLIGRYERNFLAALQTIERKVKSPREKLRRYAGIYAEVLRDGRMCLCGMLAAEYVTLPKAMQQELRHFFDENERWLVAGAGSSPLRNVAAPAVPAPMTSAAIAPRMIAVRRPPPLFGGGA